MENTVQPEYLNPESEKYYKGYRYEKDEEGTDCWYDENATIRKAIDYHDNGIKWIERYYNKEGELHNEEGYAFQSWDKNGDIKNQVYCLNGYAITEQEWKEKTTNKIKSC